MNKITFQNSKCTRNSLLTNWIARTRQSIGRRSAVWLMRIRDKAAHPNALVLVRHLVGSASPLITLKSQTFPSVCFCLHSPLSALKANAEHRACSELGVSIVSIVYIRPAGRFSPFECTASRLMQCNGKAA